MIAPKVVDEVRRLLAEGKLGQRKIAKRMRISRGTVGAIATGRRPDCESPGKTRPRDGSPEVAGPPRRCPGCGGTVYMPCRVCRVRQTAARLPRPAPVQQFGQPDEPLVLALADRHRRRYEEIRSRKVDAEQMVPGPEPDPAELADEPDLDGAYELDPADLRDALGLDDEDPLVPEYDEPSWSEIAE